MRLFLRMNFIKFIFSVNLFHVINFNCKYEPANVIPEKKTLYIK